MAIKKPLNITRGKTTKFVLRWEDADVAVAKPITAISFSSGFPRLTVASHGLTNGWPTAVTRVESPKQINAQSNPLGDSDYRKVTVVDSNTLEFNGWIPADDSGKAWSAYTSGGFIHFNTPQDLAGQTFRAKIKDKVGGTVLLSTELSDAPLNLLEVTADNVAKTITVEIPATVTEDLLWKKGVWELEAESSTGYVESLVDPTSPVSVSDEVVTP